MISLKKYVDSAESQSRDNSADAAADVLPVVLGAYRATLLEIGSCSASTFPALGQDLKQNLGRIEERLSATVSSSDVIEAEHAVREQLREWSARAVRHYRQKAEEVRDILLVMACTAESVGQRDLRCAQQIDVVTAELKTISSLDDLSLMRGSIEKGAADLKSCIDRMTAEGKAVVEHLRVEVATCRARLEQAEYIASCDAVTGLGSRPWIEEQIEKRIDSRSIFCAALMDIDSFGRINVAHGRATGDILLKQFAAELRSASRASDVAGRWGGDQFIVLLNTALPESKAQIDRLQAWACGDYNVPGKFGPLKLRVEACFGLVEHALSESMAQLMQRVEIDMYAHKAAAKRKTA